MGRGKNMKQGLWMAASLAALAASLPAQAQETSDGEIVVTAQKREQALIDVPQSVSVVSGATLERQQAVRSEEHTSELQSLMRISYAVFCLTNIYTYFSLYTLLIFFS